MIDADLPIEKVGVAVGGMMILAAVFRTWINKQGAIMAGDTSQKELIKSLTAEARKWKEAHDLIFTQHSEHMILYGELRVQNKMLRMLLIQQGMTADELNAALEIDSENHPV